MMADGQVVFEINGDNKGVKSSINDTTAALEKAGKKWDSAAKASTDSIGDRLSIGNVLLIAI